MNKLNRYSVVASDSSRNLVPDDTVGGLLCKDKDVTQLEDRLQKVEDLLRESKRKHYWCADSWYSCPKATDGCCDEREGTDCNCGAASRMPSQLRSHASALVSLRPFILLRSFPCGLCSVLWT